MNMNNLLGFGKYRIPLNLKNVFDNFKKCVHQVTPKQKDDIPVVTDENQYDVLSHIVTPWWELDYTEQLVRKKKWTRKIVETIKSKKIPRFKTKIHEVLPSPMIESYRNKDEFSIRTGIDGNDKTVGFYVGSPADGNAVCVPPIKLISLKENHILLSEIFQKLIRDSPLKACHDLHDGGYWRNLIVRSNRKGETMAIVLANPTGVASADIDDSKVLLKNRLLSTGVNITSLYHQLCPNVRCTKEQAAFDLLHGDEHIYETISNITVRISPDSFAQINTEASEILYDAILDHANVNDKTTILDLCCGTGIISLIASKYVRGCVGIESVTSAVEDAIFNADYNDITNCHFIAGRVEKKLKDVVKNLDLASEIVPIINPGRSGLSQKVIKVLRSTIQVRKLLYISCKGDSCNSLKNFQDLCCKSIDSSKPFILTDVQPVDIFPLTPHCELILVFQR